MVKSLAELIEESNKKSLLSLNDSNLLIEVKDYLQQSEIKWTVASNHVKLLCKLLVTSGQFLVVGLILSIFCSQSLPEDVR